MKQFEICLVISLLTVTSSLTKALPIQHLVTFDPNDESLAPKEIIVEAGLQVSPRADGTGDYALKEVPLISHKRSKKDTTLAEDEKVDETKSSNMELKNEDEEKELAKNVEADQSFDKVDSAEESSEDALGAELNPLNVKRPNDSGHIYITIPIYVNSMRGLPVTLSIGSQQIPLKTTGPGFAARRQALEEEEPPTSLYNKLL